MSNLEIVKKVADFLESRDLEGLQVILTDDFRAKGGTMELTKQQILGYLRIFFKAFPDHRFGFTDIEQNGDLVSCTGQETGTHQNILDLTPFGVSVTLPPTGKSFKLPISLFTFHVAGGKLTHMSEEAVQGGGLAGILEQLGVKSDRQ